MVRTARRAAAPVRPVNIQSPGLRRFLRDAAALPGRPNVLTAILVLHGVRTPGGPQRESPGAKVYRQCLTLWGLAAALQACLGPGITLQALDRGLNARKQ